MDTHTVPPLSNTWIHGILRKYLKEMAEIMELDKHVSNRDTEAIISMCNNYLKCSILYIVDCVPIDFQQETVNPVHLAIFTVEEIWSNKMADWYDSSFELMKYINDCVPNVQPNKYNRLLMNMMMKVCYSTNDISIICLIVCSICLYK